MVGGVDAVVKCCSYLIVFRLSIIIGTNSSIMIHSIG